MKFSDIVDLAKAGYKPSDIKELMSLKTPDTEPQPEPEPEPDEAPEPEPEPDKATEPKEPEIDYKALYEAEKSKVEKLQKDNASKSVGKKIEEKSAFDIVSDLYGKLY